MSRYPLSSPDEVLQLVRSLHDPVTRPYVTASDIADSLSVHTRTARRYLNRLHARGAVTRVGGYLSPRGYGYRVRT